MTGNSTDAEGPKLAVRGPQLYEREWLFILSAHLFRRANENGRSEGGKGSLEKTKKPIAHFFAFSPSSTRRRSLGVAFGGKQPVGVAIKTLLRAFKCPTSSPDGR
jgi:hypothetical protein